MPSSGNSVYWAKNDSASKDGIVVAFAWVPSIPGWQLRSYIDLYSSLGLNTLVCLGDFFSALLPIKATSLAMNVLTELLKELHHRQCPIIFSAFSGGPKACMYKIFQIIMGRSEAHLSVVDRQMVRNCISGHIYDSCPMDFSANTITQLAMHPTVARIPGSLKVASWLARGVASGLDALFVTKFELQRSEYWEALYSSVGFGAPYLILCSKDDDIAPYALVRKFSQHLQDLGAHVTCQNWEFSSHVGIYKNYPVEYRAAISELLKTATKLFHNRQVGQRTATEGMQDEISEIICDLQNTAISSNQSLRRLEINTGDHDPSSFELHDFGDPGTLLQKEQRDGSIRIPSPSIGGHSLLGQVLFDVCVPKNVEGWDIKFSGSSSRGRGSGSSACRCSPLHAIKFIHRSKL